MSMRDYNLDQLAIELFDKLEAQLQIAELQKLALYEQALRNPTWKQVYLDGQYLPYFVSDTGVVIDKDGKELTNYQQKKDWYLQVYLSSKGLELVHRLVAIAFIPNPENKPQVNHLNGKKWINWVGNLEWATAKENAAHAWKTNLVNNYGENQANSIYTNAQIMQVCQLLEEDRWSYKEISNQTSVDCKTISEVRCGTKWRSISKNYNIPKPTPCMYTDDEVRVACKLLEDPRISHAEISKRSGLSVNALKDIMKKTSYRRISDYFDIKPRLNSGQFARVSKYTEVQIRNVCRLLESPDVPIKDIAQQCNVGLSTVYDVLYGHKWRIISSEYSIKPRTKKSMITS